MLNKYISHEAEQYNAYAMYSYNIVILFCNKFLQVIQDVFPCSWRCLRMR